LNGVVKIKTNLPPQKLLFILQDIENKLGRVRLMKNGPRTIDLDIILNGDRVVKEPDLLIPHPRMFEREFVLKPLLEIEPGIDKLLNRLKEAY
jgi:2-amino-4-hydroxy-6-hydroxymethyldihydropteridine diphosphokinase